LAALSMSAPLFAAPSVTVYTRDLGFVREPRSFQVRAPRDTVRIADVPRRLDFSSVRLHSAGAKVRRLAYRFDVAGGDQLIESALGQDVRVAMRDNRVAEGVLVAADGAWLVVRSDNGAVLTLSRASVDEVRLARPPADLSLRPTLEVALEAARAGKIEAELSYLTGGLSWSAEHTVVRRGEGSAEWSAAVTVENTTGRDFVDAELKLVAGEPRRDAPPPMPYLRAQAQTMDMSLKEGGADLGEQAFAEYHLYTLDRPATLRDRESQRLSMIEPRGVKVTPRYLYRGGDPRGVASQIELVNTETAGLGVPLPAGRVRFYEADPSGDLQFTGETRIAHTPEGEKATLEIGYAFDLAAERREVSSRKISDRERESTVEIKLRNRKKAAVSIVIEERVSGDIEVIQKSHDFVRKDANTLEFTVPVPAGKEVAVRYTVRIRY
jgi:hypothetical protein